jgi:hypothetical protein
MISGIKIGTLSCSVISKMHFESIIPELIPRQAIRALGVLIHATLIP